MNHVFICNDAEDAAYFHNTLENLTEALNLHYFPSSFKNRKNYRLLNSSHVMLRTEALTRVPAESAIAGDLVAVAGIADVTIGDTLADPENPVALPRIHVDEPAIAR